MRFIDTGSYPGGMDVLSWTETIVSNMNITGLDRYNMYFISVTAINKAGLYTKTAYNTVSST